MKRYLITIVFLLGYLQFTYAQKLNKAKLDSLMQSVANANQGMGSLALSKNGVVIYQKAIGFSTFKQGKGLPATINTRYRIGSISKIFTAVLIFQLIEEGKLTMETKLGTFFPQIKNADKISVHDMLSHRSGLYNFVRDTAYQRYMSAPRTKDEQLALFATYSPDFEPGSKAEYSNTNFVLLGYIAEQLSKKSLAEMLTIKIIKKLGLTNTYYGGKINPDNNEASSYQLGTGWQRMPETDMSIPGGAGAVVSTSADLVKFIDGLFNGKLINSQHLSMMQDIKDGYGMGLFKLPFNNKSAFGHNGDIDGFSSIVGYFPEEKLAYAYCANGVDFPIRDLIGGVLKINYNLPYSIPVLRNLQLTNEELDKYTGNYSSLRVPIKITVTRIGNKLMAQATGQSEFPLKPLAKDKFGYALAGLIIEFRPIFGEFTLKQGGGEFPFTRDEEN